MYEAAEHLDAREDFFLNSLGAKQDFCSNIGSKRITTYPVDRWPSEPALSFGSASRCRFLDTVPLANLIPTSL